MDGYTARELCAEFGLSIRTLNDYVYDGILPRPTRGPHARWPHEAWIRLDEMRRAKDRRRTNAEWAEKFKSRNSRSKNGTT